MTQNDGKYRKYGIIGTIVFHSFLLLILVLTSLSAPTEEFPEPDGIMVDFGELVVGDNTGGNTVTTPENQPTQTETDIPNVVSTDEQSPVVVNKTPKTKVTETEKQPELTPEELKKIRKEEEFRQQMDALTNNLGGGGTDGQGNDGNSPTGENEGTAGNPNGTHGTGNTKGTPGNRYGNGDAVQLVKPTNTTNCNNPITLYVTINANGTVATIQRVETSLAEQTCIDAAKNAARKTTFQPDSREVRYAKITYDYTTSR